MKKRKRIVGMVAVLILTVIGFGIGIQRNRATPQTIAEDINSPTESKTGEPLTKGLIVSVSLSLDGEDGIIRATATNDFTLFWSTVYVKVELYSSTSYPTSYANMSLVASHSTPDLNMGESITAQASTGGVQKYWQARMQYQVNNGDMQERLTQVCLFNANGEIYQGSIIFSLS